jgi:hypothetical protein
MSDQGPEFPKYPGEGSAEGGQPIPPPPGPAPSAPEQPSTIATAVKLMYAGAALSLLSVIVTLVTLDTFKDTIEESVREADTGATQTTIDAAIAVGITTAVVLGLVGVGLWLWMAWKNGQGRSWARIVATVFGALNLVFTLLGFTQPGMTPVTVTIGIVNMILAVVILVLLWKKESTEYYEAVSAQGMMR